MSARTALNVLLIRRRGLFTPAVLLAKTAACSCHGECRPRVPRFLPFASTTVVMEVPFFSFEMSKDVQNATLAQATVDAKTRSTQKVRTCESPLIEPLCDGEPLAVFARAFASEGKAVRPDEAPHVRAIREPVPQGPPANGSARWKRTQWEGGGCQVMHGVKAVRGTGFPSGPGRDFCRLLTAAGILVVAQLSLLLKGEGGGFMLRLQEALPNSVPRETLQQQAQKYQRFETKDGC